MRFLPPTRTATLLLLGALASTWADDNQREERRDRDKQHENKRPQQERKAQPRQDRKVEPKQDRQPQPRQDRKVEPKQDRQPQPRREPPPRPPAQHAHRSWKEAHAWQQQRGWEHPDGWHGHGGWHENRANHWAQEHRTWSQRGGYGGYYIPHDRFGLYFGRNHWFRIHTRPVVYMDYLRFDYQGFSFVLVDPWPEDWNEEWYDSDDVYIDYGGDGYYLYNRAHPGVAIAVTVVR